MIPSEKIRPLPENKTLVSFVADEELMNMLEELKHLLAHQNFDGRMDILIKKTASIALKKLKPKQEPAPSKTQQASESAHNRYRAEQMGLPRPNYKPISLEAR
jgi:hypothetical protein